MNPTVADWLAADPDAACRSELAELVAQAATDPAAAAELADRFADRLRFGTAGLRGRMAAGPNRMNRAVVIRAAHGLMTYLKATVDQPVVVIGNDARYHSRDFAIDSAGVITAAGGRALLLPDRVPTPLLAYAVRHFGADAGVMVTASHNPAADNGYKVYLGGRGLPDEQRGVQIVPPADAAIEAAIAAAPPANQIGRAAGWTDLGDEVMASYLDAIVAGPAPATAIRIVHTALHGVGSAPVLAALRRAGFSDVVPVPRQSQPDPDFPTVGFPNPEEPGALDLAIELAAEVGADIVIASDPDADRCAAAVNDPRAGWRRLHGDEVGAILGEDAAGRIGVDPPTPPPILVSSIVSSRQLAMIAAAHGLAWRQTLTGFKWMGRVPGLVYAYEEAIGYCVRPDVVRDKDGIATALALARLVARLKAEGCGVIDLLDDLARRHGLYLSRQLAVRCDGEEAIQATMARMRAAPPAQLAGSPVVALADLADGYDGLPPTDGLLFFTTAGDRVIVRPSGTEPKVKCYLEVIAPVAPNAGFAAVTAVRQAAADRLALIERDLRRDVFGED